MRAQRPHGKNSATRMSLANHRLEGSPQHCAVGHPSRWRAGGPSAGTLARRTGHMTKHDSAKRVDDKGRAFAGSQLQVQVYVARRQTALSDAVAHALAALRQELPSIRWTAPLEADLFREPVDRAFLVALGLEDEADALRQFWPSGGPNWDALAVLGDGARRDGVLLVEAKSYPGEVYGPGCLATNLKSLQSIQDALGSAQQWFGVTGGANWTGRLYQYANRLAHVYFLRHKVGVEAWLVNLCFTDDGTTRRTTAAEWHRALPAFKTELGFPGQIPWVLDVVLPAGTCSDLLETAEAG
jgi:hypothetical protein